MRGIEEIVGFLLCFCLLHKVNAQVSFIQVQVDEGKNARSVVYSLPLPPSNEIYSFFAAQDADSRTALTLFQISERGVIRTTKPITYEIGSKNYYDLVAIRRQRGEEVGGVPTSIRISIKDTNNFSPTFPQHLYYARVKERSPADTVVMGLENCFAEDRDTVGTLSYSISSGNDKGYFKDDEGIVGGINRKFLVLKTTNVPIVIDTTPEINLTVLAFDGVSSGTTRITIKIIDVNDNSPVFEKPNYVATINEDTPLLTSVLRVRATDNDLGTNGGIYYYINGGQYFAVDAITGVIKVVRQLPNQPQVLLNVVARDRGTPSQTATVQVTININLSPNFPPADSPNPGINTPPVFPEESYTASVREDFPIGAALLVVHAIDRDPPGRNKRITYSISGDSNGAFEIDQYSGVVKLIGTLDYDRVKQHDLTVIATDQGVNPQVAKAPLTITVQEVDKNRNAPVFTPSNRQQGTASVAENLPSDTPVGSLITAVDADGNQGPDGQVEFSIFSGSGLPYFKINKDSGRLETVTPLDRERQPQYDLIIEARDKALYPLYSHLYLVINVAPEEDNNPDFSQAVYTANVPEKTPAYTFVTVIHATDRDGASVSYSIQNGGSAFTIQSNTGVITTARQLDASIGDTDFTLFVFANVPGNSRKPQPEAQVNVTVVSKQDSPPTFKNAPYSATVPENLGKIENLLCVVASGVNGAPVSYSIASAPVGKFAIDIDSGRFSATGSFDYELISGREYPVQVQASTSPQQVASAAVTVRVSDTKDPPFFSKSSYKFVISENTPSGTTIQKTNADGSSGGLVINDEDTPIRLFECTIENVRGGVQDHFRVVNPDDIVKECRIVVVRDFNHFKNPRFNFEVRATDTSYRNMFASAQVEIEIQDTNDHGPQFSQITYWASVSSNFPVRNSVLKVTATDEDSGSFGEITYELLDSEDRNRFSLDSNSGVLSSANSLAVKRYQLNVRASDRAQNQNEIKRATVVVYVSVYSPGTQIVVFDPSNYVRSLSEGSGVNTPVLTVSTRGPSGRQYSIVGGNTNDAFRIGKFNGQLLVQKTLDRETQATYNLVIRAEASNLAAEAAVTITLTDVNDNNPRITFMETEPKNVAIEDFSPAGSPVIQVIATDRDTGAAAAIKYSIVIKTSSTPFQINENTGLITASREIKKSEGSTWDISVQARDGGSPPKQSAVYGLKIHVTEGLQAPQLQPSFVVSVNEDAQVGNVVQDISPVLENSNYKYSILSGNRDDAFCINHDGVISVAKPLDREKVNSYYLMVSASVGNKVSNSTVSVTVEDQNDDAPQFTKTVYTFDVSEDKPVGREVGKVSATDRDDGNNGKVIYSLLYTVDVNSKFLVNRDTGSITTNAQLDFEQIRQHILYIKAEDQGRPVRTSIAKVILNVKDVNDEFPKFSADSYVMKVSLDEPIGTQVLLVSATDLDSGDNSIVVYNITGGNNEGAFEIDPDTGAIKVKRSLTTVSASKFTLQVEAKDKGTLPKSKSTTVQLNVFLPDGPPRFVVKPVIEEVLEGIRANGRVMVVKAATSEVLTYEILSGNEDGLFRIVPSTGEIKMTRVLDYEEAREHRFVVRVMDTRDRSDQVTVILKVKNINDNEPEFPGEVNGFVERKVEEDFQAGDPAARLSAYDKDAGDAISYELSADAFPLFSIDSDGFLIAKKPRSEIQSPVKFELTAKDNGIPQRETKVQVQLVFVSYRGDQQPVRVYVREDKDVESVVARVPRYFPGGTLSIIFPQRANFTVDNSGKVRMTAPFDFERSEFYRLTIREQEPAPGMRTSDIDVEINVVDVNDNKPKFTMIDFVGRVNSNSRPGTSAYQLKAEDNDGGLSGRVGYQMVSKGVPFGINPVTEVVETDATLQDRGGYNVTLYPFDFGVPRQFGAAVSLDIKTVNFKPQFSESAYKFQVFENAPPGVIVGIVNASSLSGARLGYSISFGITEKFEVSNSGEIQVNSKLDHEEQAIYNLKVRATELIPKGYSNEAEVQITVTNANEYYPKFERNVYEGSVPEDVSSGKVLLRVTARDLDCGETGECELGLLRYSLEETSLFEVDSRTGDIRVGSTPLDYEKQRQHVFTVVVEDFGEKIYKSRGFVKIAVSNRDDEVPQFIQSDYTIGIAEDAKTGKPLAAILARDADGNPIKYSITSGDTGNIFKINDTTGVLSLQSSVKGQRTQYTLQIKASDTVDPNRFDEVRVVVNIEDSNDNRPLFDNCPNEVPVEENRPRGERVTQVRAVDTQDRGRNKEVEYFLVTGGERLFEIDNTTGVIKTLTSLDRETKDRHTLIVMAEDGGHGRNVAERLLSYCIIDVKVVDKNDNFPIFLTRTYFASVWQGAVFGTTVLTVRAADADTKVNSRVDNSQVIYQLVNPDDKFQIVNTTGVIKTKVSLQNYQGKVQLQIIAINKQPMDISEERPRESTTTVEINVEKEKPPLFPPPAIYTTNINEDVKLRQQVTVIKATSQVNNKNQIVYSLVKSNPEGEQKFQIDPSTGNITTASTLDYEQVKEYRLQFRATEIATNLYSTCLVIIRLTDVNDDTPTFKLEEYTARVPENAPSGFNLITIEADDRDTGAFGQVVYSLETSAASEGQFFSINGNSGEIKTRREFDREDPKHLPRYNVVAKAQDKGTPPLSAKVTIGVVIVDQNDQPPKFDKPRYEVNVREDSSVGTSIGELSATDDDIGDNARLDYFVSSGGASQNFRMENVYGEKNYGILILVGKVDYETQKTYTITVTATDRKDSATVQVVINVLDTNDNIPQFSNLIYEAQVLEDSSPGLNVRKVAATDSDSPRIQSPLKYSLDAAGLRNFAINENSGQITTSNQKLDREVDPVVTFNVFAFDGKHRGQALVRVYLLDYNDNSPYFPNPPYVGYVEENLDPGASVMVLQAFDLDIGVNAEIVYTLEDNANGKFQIDRDSGLITTLEMLEKEAPDIDFTIKVKATDKGNPALSGTVTASIIVADGNDQAPVFNPTVYREKVPEDALPGYSVTQVKATDQDEGYNAELEFIIKAGNDPYEFYINPRTGEILVSGILDFDHGKKSYNLTVMVSDRGVPPKQAPDSALVYITVLDANDNPPVFLPAEYNKEVSESILPGDTVILVTATDKDTGTNAEFTFAIADGDDADMFGVRPDTRDANIGIIYTVLKLDRETVSQYNLTVTATDTGGLQGVATVRITVTDDNDNGPWFQPRYYEGTIKVTNDQTLEQTITTVRAYDPDEASNGPPFTFSIEGTFPNIEDPNSRFGLRDDPNDPETANLLFSIGPFTRLVPEWTLTIKAGDSGKTPAFNETSVFVSVLDVENENEPFDGELTIIVNAYDGNFAGGIIGKAYYQDEDYMGDVNTYTMASQQSQEYFTVNSATGDISAEANIPMGTYSFRIAVQEQQRRPNTNGLKVVNSLVTVTVLSVPRAAIRQSVTVQILALRRPAAFVANNYLSFRQTIASFFNLLETNVLIFSVQRAPSKRVPLADVFGVEIQLAVRLNGNTFKDKMEVIEVLVQAKAELEELEDPNLKIGYIGIDMCAAEREEVGVCNNKVEASSAFTVVNGDFGQLTTRESLTVVSIDTTLKAVYTSIIQPDKNCTTGTPCLHGGTCHNAVPKGIICECGREYLGPECQSTTRTFKGNSYLWLNKLAAYQRSSISLQFMTDTANGLLLYQGPLYKGANNGLSDLIALYLVDGYAKLVIDLGPHPMAPLELYMNKGDRLDDKTWHTVEVIRERKKVVLRIDKCSQSKIVEDYGQIVEDRTSCEIEGEIWGSFVYLNGFGPLQIGGVENAINDLKINFTRFKGCIRNIYDDGKMYDLFNPLKEINTELGCRLNNPCPNCNGRGYCEPFWAYAICVCDLGFGGANCDKRTSANWYRANSFTQYRVKQAKRKRRELVPAPVSMANEFYTNIALQVRVSPNSSNVVIFLASNSLGTEFNRIDVKNHVLRYVFRLGDRMKILKIPQLNVTDDKYHTVIVKRQGNRASLQIDYDGKVEGTTGGLHKLLNMGGGSFFTGGLPNITEVRVVEAFVNSGGNAILRTSDGNIVSSGMGSSFTGVGTYVSNMITVNDRGDVYRSFGTSALGKKGYLRVQRTIMTSSGVVVYGQSGVITRKVSSGGRSVEVLKSRILSSADKQKGKVVISSSASGGSGGASGGSGGGDASGSDGSVGGSGGSGGGILRSAASKDAKGNVNAYGSGFATWTIVGAAGPNDAGEVEVIGDFGGCTASNSYNGLDLDSDPSIEARRQNVEFPCPCGSNFCQHGGTCVSASPPYCLCPPGWSGPECQSIVKDPRPGQRPFSRWANPAVIACILVILLAILIIIGAVILKRRPQPAVVAVVEDGHVHDNVRPYHDEGAGEEDNFGYDITTLMKYTYVENGVAGTGGTGYGKFKNSGSSGEEEFTVAEEKPLLQGAMPGAGLHHGITTITKRRAVHPDSIDVKQFIDTRVDEADGEYILSIDEMHIYRYEGDDSDVDDLSELGDSDEEPDEEEEQEFAFLQEWGNKFDNLNRIFNEDG